MSERVLLIDDDANLLSALQRQLRKQFNLTTAEGGAAALDEIKRAAADNAPFAVALSDMRMPGMDGIETLSRIRQSSPDTVRMMLTGNADQQTAIDAINLGNIFRFFTKPCPAETLALGLQAGIDQYRLITAERELLEKTLAGSVKLLVDVVSMNDPVASAQSNRLRQWVRKLTQELNLPARWQLDIAAALVPIGLVSIPPELITKQRDGAPLSPDEAALFERAPEAARNLIANIPRLSAVAEIVYLQDRNYDGTGFPSGGPSGGMIPLDARILKILKDLSEFSGGNIPSPAAFAALEKNEKRYDPLLLKKVKQSLCVREDPLAVTVVEVPVAALRAGTVVLSDIRLTNGHLILAANTQLTEPQIERLRALRRISSFIEPIKAQV
ncbi:HD domain-containing phosphohydrolase [Magnetospirillum sulfuroxidans]|uniref:Response regulator n=1 Tax=Magnetospirillum sulfuroxidans TaxID=611300 RepID=A0ABS5IC05_9PROT|nr:HD domain-containing phosphohydrolase [Magnetospirillum sulfuroxidans]MBR9971961.1 response regulator [Magnetospirillum sulfuroxidans]